MRAYDMIWVLVIGVVLVAWMAVRVRRRGRRPIARDPDGIRSVASFSGLRFEQAEALIDENPQVWGQPLLEELLTHVQPELRPCGNVAGGRHPV
jgi:hypothetical protein